MQREENMGLIATRRGLIASAAAFGIAGKASAQGMREIRIGLASRSMASTVSRTADEMGLFAKHGLKPNFIILDSANGSTMALIARSIDFAQAGSADAIAAQSRGQKIVIVVNDVKGLIASMVLSKKTVDRLGISPNAPLNERLKALDGLTIASTSATSAFVISYGQAAKSVGAKIRFTYMSLPNMGAAMETGAIDGFTGTAPFWAFPIQKGNAVLWINGPKGELPAEYIPATSGVLDTTRDYADSHPDIVRDVAAAMADFSKAAADRPDEVKAALLKVYPEFDAKMVDLLFSVEGEAFKTLPLTPADMAHEIAFVKMGGAAPPEIDNIKPGDMLF
jgi:ABC-type nitrate/sulfonate/bicarbonate transport system substrate-binding protein